MILIKQHPRLPDSRDRMHSVNSIVILSVISFCIFGLYGVYRVTSARGAGSITPFDVTIETLPYEELYPWTAVAEGEVSEPIEFMTSEELVKYGDTKDKDWVSRNIFRVASFSKLSDTEYLVQPLTVEGDLTVGWEQLQSVFKNTPYTTANHLKLEDGVNCQGMTVYLADWCEANGYPYVVTYTARHVVLSILYEDSWYRFDFTQSPVFSLDTLLNERESVYGNS